MKEYLERDALVEATVNTPFRMSMCDTVDECKGANKARLILAALFKVLPAADVIEVKHWRWIETEQACGWSDETCAECSECGEDFILGEYSMTDLEDLFHYCPNCGAKMDGGTDNETL